MKYEKPKVEVLQLEYANIVWTSTVTGNDMGNGDSNGPNAPDEW